MVLDIKKPGARMPPGLTHGVESIPHRSLYLIFSTEQDHGARVLNVVTEVFRQARRLRLIKLAIIVVRDTSINVVNVTVGLGIHGASQTPVVAARAVAGL
jgi:hypothetical protein